MEAIKYSEDPGPDKPLNRLAKGINDWAIHKGWNEDPKLGEQLLLIISEITEAFEVIRDLHTPNKIWLENGKPEGFGIELADAIIRILHVMALYNLDADDLISRKMKYNYTRPYRHGGKLA